MALSASTVLEVRTGGADTNGGGFVTGASGTDWSQQNAAQYSVTDGVTAGTTTITSATANFGTDVVGNLIYVQGGTGSVTATWKQITARTNSTTITVDSSTGLTAGTGVTLKIGGALLSPGIAAQIATVTGMVTYIKNDGAVFSLTSASTNVAGGCLSVTANTWFVGYSTTRTLNNTDTRPTIQTNVTTATQIQGSTGNWFNIIFDGNNQTASKWSSASGGKAYRCDTINFNTATTACPDIIGGLATGNSATVWLTAVGIVTLSEAYGNSATPISAPCITDTLTYSNTGASTDGALLTAASGIGFASGLTSVSNGRDGVRFGNTRGYVLNSVFDSNAGYGINNAGLNGAVSLNNGFRSNSSGQTAITAPLGYALGSITLTGDPFVSVAGNNYALNNLAGAGAALRALALPALFPRGLTADYADIGAAQHQETSTINIFPVFD